MHTAADNHTAYMPQLYPVDGRPSCMFSLCMHPAILMPKHKKSHLLVKARIGGQMLITESSRTCGLYRPRLYSVWTSSACVPFTQ